MGGAHIVGEDQEGGTEGPETAVQGEAVHDCAHCVFPDAKMDVPAAVVPGFYSCGPLDKGLGGGARSAEPPTNSGTQAARAFKIFPPLSRVAAAEPSANSGKQDSRSAGSSRAKIRCHSLCRSGVVLCPVRIELLPVGPLFRPFLLFGGKMIGNLFRYIKFLIRRQSDSLFQGGHIFFAQRCAVGFVAPGQRDLCLAMTVLAIIKDGFVVTAFAFSIAWRICSGSCPSICWMCQP